jgi:hypothetical protein
MAQQNGQSSKRKMAMTLKEKMLYHQIHPLKLFVDISTSLLTTYFAWKHNTAWFLILFLIPSVIITILLIKYANLDRLKNSAFGKYTGIYMTRPIEAIRFGGQIIMWIAAWFHLPILIAAGALIIIAGWLNGKFFKRTT